MSSEKSPFLDADPFPEQSLPMNPYRQPEIVEPMESKPETAEAILFDTLTRLNNIDEDDAHRVVRALAAFCGFRVGERMIDEDGDG